MGSHVAPNVIRTSQRRLQDSPTGKALKSGVHGIVPPARVVQPIGLDESTRNDTDSDTAHPNGAKWSVYCTFAGSAQLLQ